MKYNRLGKAGIKVSELSLGSWLTFGGSLNLGGVKSIMRAAFSSGINFFDNAEAYSKGQAEVLMGEVIKEFRREDLVVSTKIFWGGNGPNDSGLSWKHLVEGTKNSLKRLQLEYVDLLYCHRPDPDTPIEETVRAMDYLIHSGCAFYWGTSEWSAVQLEEAFQVAKDYNCIPPSMEQPQYNMFERKKVEHEFAPLYKKYGLGLTIWSPLASGILTGKYNEGIPNGTRLRKHEWLQKELTTEKISVVKKLSEIAKELDCSLAQLALAWCLKNQQVSTVILGVTNKGQLEENLKAIGVKERLSGEVMGRISEILK